MKTYSGSSVTFKVRKADNMLFISGAGDSMNVFGPGNPNLNISKEISVPFGVHYFHMIGVNTGKSYHIVFDIVVGGAVVDTVSISGMDQGIVVDSAFQMVNSERQ